MGFAIPIASWLSNELKGLVDSYISEEKITNQGIFHWEAIAELKYNFFKGKKELDYKIWYVLMFQMWYEKWM